MLETLSAPFSAPAVTVLSAIYDFLSAHNMPSYGLAIILLAVLVRMLLLPFLSMQMQAFSSLAKLFSLHKERVALAKKYKNDEQKLIQSVDALHAKHHIAPLRDCMGGFIPILIQIPICIGIYSGLEFYNYPTMPSFWKLTDLSKPDTTGIIIALIVLQFILNRALPWLHTGKRGALLLWGMDADILVTSILSSFIIASGLWLYLLVSSFTVTIQSEFLRFINIDKENAEC